MVGYVEDILVDRAFLQNRQNEALEIAKLEDYRGIGVVSPHLMQNMAAATALARACDVSPQEIASALQNFKLAPHRIELVGEFSGVQYVDDSKATNVHAARASLRSFDKVVWICGGLLKGVDPAPLVKEFASKLSAAIVIGADTSAFQDLFAKLAPQVPIHVMPNTSNVMQLAVEKASEIAQPGETVLLAPAAASMDQFRDYADRGDKFKLAVNLIGGAK
jgi:UDP-N-acetylmuramoylalanine--D-glutamate ligase